MIILQNKTKSELIHFISEMEDLCYYEKQSSRDKEIYKIFKQIIPFLKEKGLDIAEKEMVQELELSKKSLKAKILKNIINEEKKIEIPENITKVIHHLDMLYQEIDIQNLTEEQKFNMQNLFQKRIPEIIQKYLSIAPEYRLTLKNNKGQNAEEIMFLSLDEIGNKLLNLQKEINENKLKDLTIKHQYVKEMNM
jgi:hypothetical protein